MKRRGSKLFGFFWFSFTIIIISTSFSLAYFFINKVFAVTHLQIAPLGEYLISVFFGLIFTGIFISQFSRLFEKQRADTINPIIQALDKIARGDFNIYIDPFEKDNMLNGLINSVNHMASQLGQMENMRQEFISNVSHEIQSPLTSIQGFTQALADNNLSETDHKHYLDIIESESKRLSNLTDNLLRLVSLDSDQTQIKTDEYSLDKQIQSVILINEPQWQKKNIELDINLKPVSIIADQDLLHQVWTNLLHNAIKFTPDRGCIKIKLEHLDTIAKFTIQDNGIGISEEDQIHIFERFYKADKSRTQATSGSGLGLSIVKRILELHHGTIDIRSKLTQGTTFIVSLPIK